MAQNPFTPEDPFVWGWKLHNWVNRMLGKLEVGLVQPINKALLVNIRFQSGQTQLSRIGARLNSRYVDVSTSP